MSEIEDGEVVIVRLEPADALARVYAFCTSEYYIYDGLYRKSTMFDDEDKLQFLGIAAQAARVVDLIRAFNPEIAAREDGFYAQSEIKPIPLPHERDPDVRKV